LLGYAHHLAHLHDNLGERQSALLLRCDFRLNRQAKRIYVRKETFVILGDEIGGQPGCHSGTFHERLGGEEGVARSARRLPEIEADQKCGLVGNSRT
jgi:hypothetical protein